MQISVRAGLASLAALVSVTGAQAQENRPQPACSAEMTALPAELAAWPDRKVSAAADEASNLSGAQIESGRAIDAQLRPMPAVRYVLQPEKPGGPDSFGGLFALRIDEAGTYRVALGAAAWIDLIGDGSAVASTAHGHGPACSGIRKVVDFVLSPGSYVLQVSASAANSLPLLVTRLS